MSRSQSLQDAETQNQQHEDIVAQGYTVHELGGRQVTVPSAFGAVDLPLAHMHMPNYPNALDKAVGPGETKKLYSTPMAGGFVEARVDPGHSERERHLLHAEVIALQRTLGISYKDAAHRLFMAEVERVKKADSASKSFAAIRLSLQSVVTSDILPPIEGIDNGMLDDYKWRNGKWVDESEQ